MGYDRGDSFPFDFKPNGIPFGSENRKETYHQDHIPFTVKGNGIQVFSEIRPLPLTYLSIEEINKLTH